MNRSWSALAVTALVVGFASGCSSDPCADVTCKDGEVCEEGTCVAPTPANKCEGKPANFCPSGTGCNPATGGCVNLCNIEGAPTCEAPAVCEASTGKCVDKCAGKTCSDDKTCNQANGLCESKCKNSNCTAAQECIATTGECVARCETATKPRGQAECGEGLKCEPTTGECLSACQVVQCSGAQYCDPVTGSCKNGKAPAGHVGSACTDPSECGRPDAPPTQVYDCVTSIESLQIESIAGGYCVAECASEGDCPQGSLCAQGQCVDLCARDSDCRGTPWRCTPIGSNVGLCLPDAVCEYEDAAQCGAVGADCEVAEDCKSGSACITETTTSTAGATTFTGFEGGACVWYKNGADSCPAGSVGLQADQNDPTVQICLKRCTFGQVGACGVGEACLPINQAGTINVCYPEVCTTDAACNVTECDATNAADVCGAGRTCQNGSCSTVDTCSAASPCSQGQQCVAGECASSVCDAPTGLCVFDCRRFSDTYCGQLGTGLTCNQGTGHCDRACTAETAAAKCGNNAVCVDGECEVRCTANNEAAICASGEKCNLVTGVCGAACTADSCGDGENCISGRCTQRCDVEGGKVCSTSKICNMTTGNCEAPATP